MTSLEYLHLLLDGNKFDGHFMMIFNVSIGRTPF